MDKIQVRERNIKDFRVISFSGKNYLIESADSTNLSSFKDLESKEIIELEFPRKKILYQVNDKFYLVFENTIIEVLGAKQVKLLKEKSEVRLGSRNQICGYTYFYVLAIEDESHYVSIYSIYKDISVYINLILKVHRTYFPQDSSASNTTFGVLVKENTIDTTYAFYEDKYDSMNGAFKIDFTDKSNPKVIKFDRYDLLCEHLDSPFVLTKVQIIDTKNCCTYSSAQPDPTYFAPSLSNYYNFLYKDNIWISLAKNSKSISADHTKLNVSEPEVVDGFVWNMDLRDSRTSIYYSKPPCIKPKLFIYDNNLPHIVVSNIQGNDFYSIHYFKDGLQCEFVTKEAPFICVRNNDSIIIVKKSYTTTILHLNSERDLIQEYKFCNVEKVVELSKNAYRYTEYNPCTGKVVYCPNTVLLFSIEDLKNKIKKTLFCTSDCTFNNEYFWNESSSIIKTDDFVGMIPYGYVTFSDSQGKVIYYNYKENKFYNSEKELLNRLTKYAKYFDQI